MNNRTKPSKLTAELANQLITQIAGAHKTHIKQSIKKMGMDIDKNPIAIILELEDPSQDISSNTKAWIKKEWETFLKKNLSKDAKKIGINILDHNKQDKNSSYHLEDPSEQTIKIFSDNLKALSNSPILNLKNDRDKGTKLIELFFREILFNPLFMSKFPNNKTIPNISLQEIDIYIQSISDHFKSIQTQMANIWDDLVLKLQQLLEFTELDKDENQVQIGIIPFSMSIFSQNIPHQEKWDKISCMYSLIEDTLETTNSILNQLESTRDQFQALETIHSRFVSAMTNIEPQEQRKLLMLSSLLPIEKLTIFLHPNDTKAALETADSMLNINKTTYAASLKTLDLFLMLKIDHFQNELQSKSTPPLTTASPISNINSTASPKLDAALNEPAPKNQSETTISTPDLANTPTTFVNETAAYKREAKAQIEKENARKAAHRNRFLPPPSADVSEIEALSLGLGFSSSTETQYQTSQSLSLELRYSSQTEMTSAFKFKGTEHLHLCCEVSYLSGEKFEAFKSVANQAKQLARNHLGSSGIKIYGLNCLIVKSKLFPAEHLLFVAHSIPGTQIKIYLPHEIISHTKYERLLRNESELNALANKARAEFKIYLTEEPTPQFTKKM